MIVFSGVRGGLYFACTSVAPNNYNFINIAQRTPYHTLLCSLGQKYLSSETCQLKCILYGENFVMICME